MLPVLLVVVSFVLGLTRDRRSALRLSVALVSAGIVLVVVMSFVQNTDFLDGPGGYVQLAAGFAACIAAALAGSAVRAKRSATAA